MLATSVLAHDFWLIPGMFRLAEGDVLAVRGQTSSLFPTSESAVTVDRVADARVIGSDGAERVTDLSVAGTSLVLRHGPRGKGQRVVAVRIHPRSLRESPESFRRYMELEGAPEALERYGRAGLLPTDSITRRYAKYAKAMVEVGRSGPRAYQTLAGHPLEFVPVTDPDRATPGDRLAVRVLFEGKPLANAPLHAGVAASADASGPLADAAFTSDANGVVHLPLERPGIWNVRALHIVPAPAGSGADWDVHWATLVFAIRD